MKKKNIAIILTLTAIVTVLSGCKKDETSDPENLPDEVIEEVVEDESPEIKTIEINFTDEISLVSISYSEETKELKYGLKNNTMFPLSYGASFNIYQKAEDEKYLETGHIDEITFDMALRSVEIDGFINETINFEMFEKKFEDGTYYIIKQYENGDGTEAGKHIPLVTFQIKDGKVYQKEAGTISYEPTVNSIHNILGFRITEDLKEPVSFTMVPEFYEINKETKERTKIDFGFEDIGGLGQSNPDEEYIWEIEFQNVELKEEGNYEAIIKYSYADGTSNNIVIPFFVRYNLEDIPKLKLYLYPLDYEEWSEIDLEEELEEFLEIWEKEQSGN